MRILGVGQNPIRTLAEFEAAIRRLDLGKGLPLIIQSTDGRTGAVLVGGEAAPKP